MEYLHLEASNSVIDGKSRRVTHLREDGSTKKMEIFYEFDRIVPWSEHTLLDGHVFAILLYASSQGKPLRVHGAVSHAALRNLEELQLAWRIWKPEIYKKIEIIPDRVDNSHKIAREEKAIAAFSGGVDAMFTALRHTKILPKSIGYPLQSLLMVHGFDVDVYNFTAFEQLVSRIKPFVDDLNVELRMVRTNSRDLKIQDWDDSFALELAGCLHMYSDEFEFGIIGSSEAYDALVMPLGSTPATDYLMSGEVFSIIHDGAGFSRTDKVAEVKNHQVACETLKVCWAGANQSGNCGKCEKCVRTQMNFLATGATSNPACFSNELDVNDINNIKIHTEAQLAEMVSIVSYAEAHNVNGQWLTILKARIAEWKPTDPKELEKQKKGGIIKRVLVKTITKLGLAEPAKKIWRKSRRYILKAVE